ncbi:conserved hypothetical protein [Thermotoga petrophila RKU-10]|jgi:hypothetical protein|uniref:Antitoxin SocA-like Panacea domain-containing protein n=2 Tax=Thermotoga petrophila TaxID=93929 RepID=A5ING0_THEP1|nr:MULTISPECIES: type II toxin-antitoxin system antitoxin SocA domain-containing protein [Thermotoga]MBZ4661770.1 hypothetical protein [Thermotoga sp.]ABQ47733.1 hypothetical protein Tpet_1728 [Thermotoga petrophila RKU-1]ADA67809.1 conserved hypothetical protein [Thermotoga petrophila RKU-10]KAF2959158.1 hypothetical protein AS158_08950 [Thermotoga sp. 38H-to]KHC90840.1 hypothetical protein Mc24_06438 [Thermotoga sp. Mc24]
MRKTYEVIRAILRKTGPILKTKLLKLLFLVDYYAIKKIGKQITDLDYKKYFYGPYDKNFELVLNKMYVEGLIHTEEHIIEPGPFETGKINLSNEEKEILDEVLQKYGEMTLNEVLEEIYKLDEIKKYSLHSRIGSEKFEKNRNRPLVM